MKALTNVLKSETLKPLFLGALLAILPFIYGKFALDAYLMPRSTIAAAIIFLALVFFTFNNKIQLPQNPVTYALAAYLAAGILSLLFSDYWIEGINTLLKTITFLAVFSIAASTSWTANNHFLTFSKGLVVFTLGLSVFSFYHIYEQDLGWQYSEVNYPALKGQMGHPNLMASALGLSLFAIFYVLWKAGRVWQIMASLAVIMSLYLVYLSHSRAALLSLFSGMAFLFLLHFKFFLRLILLLSHKWVLTGITLIVVLAFFLVYQPQSKPTQNLKGYWPLPLEELNSSDKQFSAQERLLMWKGTWRMIENEGPWGVGPGAWRIEFPKYGSDIFRARQGNVQFQRPHNDFLWILSEWGILGLLSFGALLIFAFRQGVLYLRQNPKSLWVKVVLTVLISYIVVSLFSFPRERVFHQILLFTLLGSLSTLNASKPALFKKRSWILSLPLAGAVLLGLLSGYHNWQGERLTRSILSARAQGNWQEVIAYKNKAEPYFLYQLTPTSMPLEFYSGLAYMNLQNYTKATKEYQIAHQIHPYNIKVINNLANVHLMDQNPDQAVFYYKKALDISYNYKEAILNLASIYHNTGRSEQAYSLLRERAAVFNDSKELYEQYVYVSLLEVANRKGIDIISDKSMLLKKHYYFAYTDTISTTNDILNNLKISQSEIER